MYSGDAVSSFRALFCGYKFTKEGFLYTMSDVIIRFN